MKKVVVRFAPSPTGYLHIGGARTAIFNWLYARKHNGTFILRIEDTDTQRSTPEAIEGIVEGLRWLGLGWDKGPYFQSDFVKDHLAAAQTLIQNGWAYKCFCTKESLEQKREQARREKSTYQYDRACRNLTPEEVEQKEKAGHPFVVRLKVPMEEGGVLFEDRVYGRIEKRYRDIDDFVIVRANGKPLYVLSNAVDDIRDGVTHVIRGQDGLANTPKQILIYQGLKADLPQFAHMSLTLDPQKAKISKRRHGERVAIHYYRNNGFLPWAMVNFLVLLGWSTTDSRQFFSEKELISAFDLNGIGRTNSVFNIGTGDDDSLHTDPKLLSMNAQYIRSMPLEKLVPLVKATLEQSGLWNDAFVHSRHDWFHQTVEMLRTRCQSLSDFATHGKPFFGEASVLDEQAWKNLTTDDQDIDTWLPALADLLEGLKTFDRGHAEAALRDFLKSYGLKPKQLIHVVRTAVTGQEAGPDFMQVLVCLGQKKVVDRLRRAVEMTEHK